MSQKRLFAAAMTAALLSATAPAAAALNLANYSVALQRGIDFDEASGVAFNYDKNILFVVDDEGDDLAEFTLAGVRLTADKINNVGAQTGGYRDIEGVTYVGNGQYVLAEERTEELIRIGVVGTNAPENGLPSSQYTNKPDAQRYLINGGAAVGNNGLEGVAFDPITGGYFGVKQGGTPSIAQRIYFNQVSFGGATTGTTSIPFDAMSLGLASLSDIAVLATVPGFVGTDYYTNLLLLSLDSNRLVEVSRTGQLLSSFDLSGLRIGGIEGVTLDRAGNIYLVGETGGVTPGDPSTSGLVVLSRNVAPVPEPATWAMMIGGFALVGGAMRRGGRPAVA